MFLRFSKGMYSPHHAYKYKKAVLIGGALVMEYGSQIIGIAKITNETDKYCEYDITVAGANDELNAEHIARSIKDMIGRANKFAEHPSSKRRRYHVSVINSKSLPVNVGIIFCNS